MFGILSTRNSGYPKHKAQATTVRTPLLGTIFSLIGGLLFTTPAASNSSGCSIVDYYPSIVRIQVGNSSFSGVVVESDSIVTVFHGLPTDGEVIVDIQGQHVSASLVAAHQGADIALLRAETLNTPPIPLSAKPLRDNEPVIAIGYPGTHSQKVSHGRFIRQRLKGLHTSAHIDAGSSGGALLHCYENQWELSGILRSYVAHQTEYGLVNAGQSYATPVNIIRQLFEMAH
ncbi:MAG: hypothetical protein CMF25_07355 [Kangiellaceae bacterium]|nr:hypothetical protein [Kangiellaceae bacterium]